jgi:nucleotide-binding universal stress UspA family protein
MSLALEPERAEPLGELKLHRLLVAVDGSENGELALKAAITAAHRDHAALTLITVGPELAGSPAVWLGAGIDQASVDQDICRELSRIVDRVPEDIPVKTIYRRGKAGPEIVKAAKEGDYDAIVIGARGRGKVGTLLGSVSHYVLHHAGIAVFVAHAPRGAEPPR